MLFEISLRELEDHFKGAASSRGIFYIDTTTQLSHVILFEERSNTVYVHPTRRGFSGRPGIGSWNGQNIRGMFWLNSADSPNNRLVFTDPKTGIERESRVALIMYENIPAEEVPYTLT